MGMIKLPQTSIDFFKENQEEIFESGNLAEGKWNSIVAEWTSDYTKSQYALAVNSNGAGMFTLLRLLKEYRGKKKIFLQSNTMYGVRTIAITSGLELCGYVDCELDYLMPIYQQVADFISSMDKPEESVFLLTHIGGWVNPDIKKIAELCREKRVALIEDCAHSLGSLLNGKHTGLFGDAGVYSLYATKTVPVGEGGIIVTNDQELNELAQKFVIYDRFDQQLDVGVNLRMSEINALLTYSVIKETESIIANKYKISEKYQKACDQYGWEYINPSSNNQRSNLYKFILLAHGESPETEFEQIKTRTSPVYDYKLGRDTVGYTMRHICLPIWYLLEDEIVEKVLVELQR
jgi:perosamine synthetase